MKLIGTKFDTLANLIYYVELGGRHYSLKMPEHFFLRAADRWAAKGIRSFEDAGALVLESVTDLQMATHILRCPIDSKKRTHLVWDKRRDIVYAMHLESYQISVPTTINETSSRFYHAKEDVLLVVEKNGMVRQTTDKETPQFCPKYGK